MELKKIIDEEEKGYAKKDEITKKEMKKFTPKKWITASVAGLVTLLYASPKNGIQKIGVVFGCVSLDEVKHSDLWYASNRAIGVSTFATAFFIITFIVLLIYHAINKKKFTEKEREESIRSLRIFKICCIVCVVIYIILSFIISLDL